MVKERKTNTLKVINRSGGLNYYFVDEKGNYFYWYTNSDKAFEELFVDSVILCSYQTTGERFEDDLGRLCTCIKNVRYKSLEKKGW